MVAIAIVVVAVKTTLKELSAVVIHFNPSFQFSPLCIILGHYYLILLLAFTHPFILFSPHTALPVSTRLIFCKYFSYHLPFHIFATAPLLPIMLRPNSIFWAPPHVLKPPFTFFSTLSGPTLHLCFCNSCLEHSTSIPLLLSKSHVFFKTQLKYHNLPKPLPD